VTVSPQTDRKLREAMSRLLAGTPLHTDGALTKENLAREAGVSHATVHRAAGVLAEWDAKVARPVLRSAAEVRRDETIATLSRPAARRHPADHPAPGQARRARLGHREPLPREPADAPQARRQARHYNRGAARGFVTGARC
jgi:hypothetical protein